MNLKDYLNENPISFRGDLKNDTAIAEYTSRIIEKKWDKVGDIKIKGETLLAQKMITPEKDVLFIVGRYNEKDVVIGRTKFLVFGKIKLRKEQIRGKTYWAVSVVVVPTELQGSGIATELYKFLSKDFTIISDRIQYDGARKLWTNLSINSIVDVIDEFDDKFLIKKKLRNKTR